MISTSGHLISKFPEVRFHRTRIFTYKDFDGYAPIMAYIGIEGYAINFELREGKQHCQKGTVEFLQGTINLCHKLTDKPLLIRLDSGNDSIDNVAVLMDAGCFFIIK